MNSLFILLFASFKSFVNCFSLCRVSWSFYLIAFSSLDFFYHYKSIPFFSCNNLANSVILVSLSPFFFFKLSSYRVSLIVSGIIAGPSSERNLYFLREDCELGDKNFSLYYLVFNIFFSSFLSITLNKLNVN